MDGSGNFHLRILFAPSTPVLVSPRLAWMPEQPTKGILKGSMTGKGGSVATGKILRGGSSDVV